MPISGTAKQQQRPQAATESSPVCQPQPHSASAWQTIPGTWHMPIIVISVNVRHKPFSFIDTGVTFIMYSDVVASIINVHCIIADWPAGHFLLAPAVAQLTHCMRSAQHCMVHTNTLHHLLLLNRLQLQPCLVANEWLAHQRGAARSSCLSTIHTAGSVKNAHLADY